MQPTELILQNNQAAIDAIRATGAEQLILAPGNGFTGGHSWTQVTGTAGNAPSSDFMNMLVDPLNNTAIDIHEVRIFFRSCVMEDPLHGHISTWTKTFRVAMILALSQVCTSLLSVAVFLASLCRHVPTFFSIARRTPSPRYGNVAQCPQKRV